MENQETITCPTGKIAVVKKYFISADRRKIRGTIIGVGDPGKLSIQDTEKIENALLETGVISYDGKTDTAFDEIMNSDCRDFDFLMENLTGKLNLPKPKTTDIAGGDSSAQGAAS